MTGWQKALAYLIAIALYTAMAVGAGWAWRGEHVIIKEVKVETQAKGASDTVLSELADTRVQNEWLKSQLQEVLNHVSNSPSCIFTRGDVSVLNHARTGLPDATALTDAEKPTPASLTQRAEIQAHADCGERFRELASQHDALVEWLQLSGRKP